MKSDYQIQQDVISQLKWEPMLKVSEIGVSVKNGIVTLSGILDSYIKKIMAEKAAKKVSGIKAVALDIQVGLSPDLIKTDSEIAEMVFNALRLHTAIQEDKIKIKVEDGLVTLDGEVEWEYQRKAVRAALENLPGVRDVVNLVIVKPKLTASDVESKIKSAFQRSASIDADMINVELIGSKVTLRGRVRSMAEKEDAEEAVWCAPGINLVENKLEVEEEVMAF